SPVDLNDLLKDVSEMFIKKAAQKRLGIIIDLTPDLVVPGDEYRLEQIFINLIENAIKYSEADELNIKGRCDGDNIVISVCDNGIGIDEDKLERLFERFFRVDKGRSRDMGGTGLGLSIVKHAVSLHDGTITVSSHKGEGTKFDLVFPLDKV
ncbi:MAG: sensor histidine kinase, partial [Candidatus Muiribacteriaceae bacterium]